MKPHFCCSVKALWLALVLLAGAATSLRAEDVFITSFFGLSSADVTPCPPSCVTGSVSPSGSTATSSPTPTPIIPASSRKARYGYAPDCSWSVTPTDLGPLFPTGGGGPYYFTTLHHVPSVYKIYVTQNNASSASADVVVNMTATGGILADTNGIQQTSIPLTVFQAGQPRNVWIPVGFISNNVPNPTITFTYASGTLSQTARWYMDAVRFENSWCCCPYIPILTVISPLAASQTSVFVTNVVAGATNVTVYADGVPVGSTNYAAGFAAGRLMVPTAPLVAGSILTAAQIKGGCPSMIPVNGPTVEPLLIMTPFTGATAIWGRSASLSVVATGADPLGYQWFKDGAVLGSATGSTYNLPVVRLGDAGCYSVVVSNQAKSLTNSGPLVVRPADLEFHLEPGRCAGINITGAVGNTYQMQSTADLGETNSWLTLTNLTLQQPVQYWLDTSLSAATNARRFYRLWPVP